MRACPCYVRNTQAGKHESIDSIDRCNNAGTMYDRERSCLRILVHQAQVAQGRRVHAPLNQQLFTHCHWHLHIAKCFCSYVQSTD